MKNRVYLCFLCAAGILCGMFGMAGIGFCAQDITVSDISAQVVEKGSDNYSIAVNAVVTNHGPTGDIIVDIIAVDKDGYQLEKITLRGRVKQGKTKVLVDMMKISKNLYQQIAGWELKE